MPVMPYMLHHFLHPAALLGQSHHGRDRSHSSGSSYLDFQFVIANGLAEHFGQRIARSSSASAWDSSLQAVGDIRINSLEVDIFILAAPDG